MTNIPTLKDFISNIHNNTLELLIESNEYINNFYTFNQAVDENYNGDYVYIKSSTLTLNYDDTQWFNKEIYTDKWKVFLDYYNKPDSNYWFVVCRNMFYKFFDDGNYNYISFLINYSDSSHACNWKPWRNSYAAYWKSNTRETFVNNAPIENNIDLIENSIFIPIITTQSERSYTIQLSNNSNFSQIEDEEVKSGYDIILDYKLQEKQYYLRIAENLKNGTKTDWYITSFNVNFNLNAEDYNLDFELPVTGLPQTDINVSIKKSKGAINIIKFITFNNIEGYYSGFYYKDIRKGAQFTWKKIDNTNILFTTYNDMGYGSTQWCLYDNPSYYESYSSIFIQTNYNYNTTYNNPTETDGFILPSEYNVSARAVASSDSNFYPSVVDKFKWKINSNAFTEISDNSFNINLNKSIIPYKIIVSQSTSLDIDILKEKEIYINNIDAPIITVNTDDVSGVICKWNSGNIPIPSKYINGNYKNVSYWDINSNVFSKFYENASSTFPCYFVCVYLEKDIPISVTIRTINDSGSENQYVYPCVYAPGEREILNYGYNNYYGSYTFTPDTTGYYAIGCYDENWAYGYGTYYTYRFTLNIIPSKIEKKYPFKGTNKFRYRIDENIDNNIWSEETSSTSITKDYSGDNIYDIANIKIPDGKYAILFDPKTGNYYKWNGKNSIETQSNDIIFTQHKIEVQEKDSSNNWSSSGFLIFVIEKSKLQQSNGYIIIPENFYILLNNNTNEYLWNGKNILPNTQTNIILDD